MGRILSQEEIDALLAAGPMAGPSRGSSLASHETATTYNFRRPDRVSKEQIRSLHFLHDRFARNVSTSLSAYLRTVTEVAIVSVEQFTYSEFLMSLPDPTAFYALSLHPVEGLAALELNPSVAFTMIDRMLGGSGQRIAVDRALTEIEQNVIDGVVKLILENLSETWAHIVPVTFRITGRETRPQMLQVAAPNDAMLLVVFDLKIAETRGMLNLCIPAAGIEAFGASFTQSWYRTQRQLSGDERRALYENLGRVPFQVSVVLETSLRARELLQLRPGDVLSLGQAVTRPLVVKVGSTPQFEGSPVRIGANAGIRIDAAREQAAARSAGDATAAPAAAGVEA